jgi:hypothetical protein
MTTPWDEDAHPGISELLFDPAGRFGPIPFRPGLLDLRDLETRARAHLWAACSEAILARQPAARWYAEKVAVPCGPLLDAGIPLHIIDCVRDPRDVLASIRAFTTQTGVGAFGRQPGEPEAAYLSRFVARFAARLDEMAATPPSVERLTVRYEDAVVDPSTIAMQLGDWLGLELDPTAGDRFRDDQPQHVTTTSARESIGRWRTDLSDEDAESVWSALGPRLTAFGYTRSSS